MDQCDSHSGGQPAWSRWLCLAALLAVAGGCSVRDPLGLVVALVDAAPGGPETDVLRIATTWPRSEQQRLEKDFLDRTSGPVPVRLVWIEVSQATRFEVLAARALPADFLLGGPVSEYVRLSLAGRLETLPGEDHQDWKMVRRQQVVLTDGNLRETDPVALDDPRIDPPTLAWAAGQLNNGSWQDGYARLVLLFSRAAHRPGWQSGSALAAVSRREAAQTLHVSPLSGTASNGDVDSSAIAWNEGAAILRGNRHPAQARAFLRFLADQRGAVPGRQAAGLEPELNELEADLLGATLVDAQEELRIAASALARIHDPALAQARAWLTESPPWPPASVAKLQLRGGDNALALVQELAGQIAPEAESRFWLVQSWLRPARPIDLALFTELCMSPAGAGGEPRFRAWLREEWTAWARQRYRRLARVASSMAAAKPAPPSQHRCHQTILNQVEGRLPHDSRHR